MLTLKTLFLSLLLLGSIEALSKTSSRQATLAASHESSNPSHFTIPISKRSTSAEEHQKLISFLQQAHIGVTSSSFLQNEIKPIVLGEAGTTGKIPLQNHGNTQYVGKIGIGSKNPIYNVVFDTGSTPFFVASTLCQDSGCLEHNRYPFDVSKTLRTEAPFLSLTVIYGSGAVVGTYIRDDVYVGDITVPEMQIFLIGQQNNILDNAQFDGIMGLAFPQIENGNPTIYSLFDMMVPQLAQPYFSFYLRRNDEPDSYLMFGGYNEDHIASPLVWHDVVHTDYWMLTLTNVYIGNQSIEYCKVYKCGVVIDSGTSLLTSPTHALSQMQNLLGVVSCSDFHNLPALTFEIDDQKYDLSASEYAITIDQNGNTNFYSHAKEVSQCMGLFLPMDMVTKDGVVIFLLGDTFFTKYYAVFDRGNRRIGLALQKRD